MTAPLIILHRRNRLDQLSTLLSGAWIEIDIDVKEGEAVLAKDSAMPGKFLPLAEFLPQALRRGVAGFVFDCKRENAALAAAPLVAEHAIENYFFLNETEIVADEILSSGHAHKTALRIWQYRGARDLIRYAEDRKKAKQNAPAWAWIDSWHRNITDDVGEAAVPLVQADAHGLQKLGVRLCIASPELYVHSDEEKYKPAELEELYRGIVRYRQRLLHTGIQPDAACTKFPWLWTMDTDLLLKAKSLAASY